MNYVDIVARREEHLGQKLDEMRMAPGRSDKTIDELLKTDVEFSRLWLEYQEIFNYYQAVREVWT